MNLIHARTQYTEQLKQNRQGSEVPVISILDVFHFFFFFYVHAASAGRKNPFHNSQFLSFPGVFASLSHILLSPENRKCAITVYICFHFQMYAVVIHTQLQPNEYRMCHNNKLLSFPGDIRSFIHTQLQPGRVKITAAVSCFHLRPQKPKNRRSVLSSLPQSQPPSDNPDVS